MRWLAPRWCVPGDRPGTLALGEGLASDASLWLIQHLDHGTACVDALDNVHAIKPKLTELHPALEHPTKLAGLSLRAGLPSPWRCMMDSKILGDVRVLSPLARRVRIERC
jgi:hypothetical protein